MDNRFLEIYNEELLFMREMGVEFAQAFPKIAGRLGLSKDEVLECADPYVERLIEGFAFMAARVKHKLEARFPDFTEQLIEQVYPHFLAPIPSMLIAHFAPDFEEPALKDGYTIARGTALRSMVGKGQSTAAVFSTSQDVTLWPLEVSQVSYLSNAAQVTANGAEIPGNAKAGLQIRFKTNAGVALEELTNLDRLPVYLHGDTRLALLLYEQIIARSVGYIVRPVGGISPWQVWRDKSHLQPMGFATEEALLPYTKRSFSGYRLLQEYFAFPQRYRFFEFAGLQDAFAQASGTEVDVTILFSEPEFRLENLVETDMFRLYCAPAINLFEKHADRIQLTQREHEYHVLADRSRPMDFEVHSILETEAFTAGNEDSQKFYPMYGEPSSFTSVGGSYYSIRREARMLSNKQKQLGTRSSYVGNEIFVALVDEKQPPYNEDLKHLNLKVLCTNRDLPVIGMPIGKGRTDFSLDQGVPVLEVRCLEGPSRPRQAHYYGDRAWQLINHLSLNYLSLLDEGDEQAAAMLRKMLALYTYNDSVLYAQVNSITRVSSRPINTRLPDAGPITYVRGVEITVECDEQAFEGASVFLFGSVLREFFVRYASIHSFVSLRLLSTDRGEVYHWQPALGKQQLL